MSFLERTQRQMPLRPLAPLVSAAALLLGLHGCAPQSESTPATEAREAAAPIAEVTRPAMTGEVPAELMESILDDLVKEEGLQRADIEIERAESVIWPSGGLGCPEPGVMYTQAQVLGYWVVLRAAEKQYDYRVSEKGYFRRCEGSSKSRLPVG
jgi:hypothetical protein